MARRVGSAADAIATASATSSLTAVGGRPVAMARVAAGEDAVSKYGTHLATPAAQGSSEVPLPKEFEALRQRTLALQEEEYWVAHSLEDEALEFRLQAVAFVSHGAFLHKFRKSGREKPHRRFVKVTGGEGLCILHWEKKSAAVVRADAEVYESCFQGVDLLDEGTCFQVILEKRMLFFQAESPEELQLWVSGVNAIVTGEAVILAEEALGARGALAVVLGELALARRHALLAAVHLQRMVGMMVVVVAVGNAYHARAPTNTCAHTLTHAFTRTHARTHSHPHVHVRVRIFHNT